MKVIPAITDKPYNSNLIIEQSGMNKNVRVFKRKEAPDVKPKKLQVAAYCRVSTDREEQEKSLAIQMETFQEMITKHPDWELAGIYADPANSGTSIRKRVEFNKMIEDAKSGKIDLILAKSLSRFARNTEDTLRYTRMLRNMGVGVIFEKEKLDTRNTSSEMLLTIYAAFCQEESHITSELSKTSIRNDAERGKTRFHAIYGYTSRGKKKWIIVPEEAEIINWIFGSYVKGKTTREIADELNIKGTLTRAGKMWNYTTISNMLQNEKYIGDYCFQKSYVENYITHKSRDNRDMVVPQYYITDDHEALVQGEVFTEVQRIISMRDARRGSNLYPYYGFLVCPDCGTPLVSFVLPMQSTPKCWVCPGSKAGIKRKDRSDCVPFTFHEKVINEAVRTAILGLDNMDGVEKHELKEIQKTLKRNNRIERYYLKTLVDKITFSDYENMEVFWKNGEKTTVPLNIKGYWSHPYPEEGLQKNGFVEYGGEEIELRRMDSIKKAAEIKSDFVRNLEIIMPDLEDPIQLPMVRRGA